jgi:uncharacterized damage-inducible protein DinB
MHTLVQMLNLTRKEFERNLEKLTDEDARKHIEPMNCISWIIAHVACQHRAYFVDWPADRVIDARYLPYGYGAPPSEPPLEEVMGLWRDVCKESEAWLQAATKERLQDICKNPNAGGESWGTLLARCIFHTWYHMGEINSIRQILGHKPPQFVNMHEWAYDGT